VRESERRIVMKSILLAITLLASHAFAVLPAKPTDYSGKVVAVSPQSISVEGRIGTRVFAIYPGTIFGRGAKGKLSDFFVGTPVTVVFSDTAGALKAENIRKSDPPKKPAPKKK
jgi:hypothetical protein